MDILTLTERIQQTILLGESQFREFKSAFEGEPTNKKPRDPKNIAKDIAETLVAFANADGGELLVGVEDDGTITGLSHSESVNKGLLIVPQTRLHEHTPLNSVVARQVDVQSKQILYFQVDKSTTLIHQTSDGKCLQRKDRENRPVSAVQLQFERQEQISREYDRQFVENAQVTDLNLDVIDRVTQHLSTKMSPEKCLQYLGLAEYGMGILRLRRAALLLFAKEIIRWHPRCQVRILRVRGTELKTGRDYNAMPEEIATGNVLQLIGLAWEKLRPHLVETKFTSDGRFQERVMYPEDACREALINAITHRDYSIEGQGIEITIFDDRMEVQSPGGLLSTVKVEGLRKLQGLHESRNALLARTLREMGYVREMGEGMRRIYLLMQDADLVPPELATEPTRFKITLRYKSVFSDLDQQWLDLYKPLTLSRAEMLIALMGKTGELLSPQQIYDRLGLVDWDMYRQIVDTMQLKGILQNTMSKAEKIRRATNKGVQKRKLPRLLVRSPESLVASLQELLSVTAKQQPVEIVDSSFLIKVLEQLPKENPYHVPFERMVRTFRILGLVDEQRIPTPLLSNLWRQAATLEIAESSHNKPNVDRTKQVKQPAREVYIGGLNYGVTQQELLDLLSPYGTVVSVTIPRDFVSQKGRGFAFIKMSSPKEAERIIEELNGYRYDGRILRLDWSFYK